MMNLALPRRWPVRPGRSVAPATLHRPCPPSPVQAGSARESTDAGAAHPALPAPVPRRDEAWRRDLTIARLQALRSARTEPNADAPVAADTAPAEPVPSDPLTGLPTRAAIAALTQRLERAEGRAAAPEVCVLRLDLLDLRPVEDRLGAAAGDHLRTRIAARMTQCLRDRDIVVRLDGDAFLLLLPCPAGEAADLARRVATRLLHHAQRPVGYLTLSGLRAGCSIGGAVWRPGADAAAEAVRRADGALDAATRSGPGQFRHAMQAVAASDARAEALCA